MNASVATVPNFFQQAPVIQDPTSQQFLQQQFLECLFQKKTVVTSFPMGYRAASLYALPAMMSDGMAVVLCPDRFAVARNLRHFRQTGFGFPEVAALDGAQMPHEEREVRSLINRRQVRLLYVTPEKFVSLEFLQLLVHAPVSFLVVEEAQFLLREFSGGFRYEKLRQALKQLKKRPPLVLLCPLLSPKKLRGLLKVLAVEDYELLNKPPVMDKTLITVHRLLTEQQKLTRLMRLISRPGKEAQEQPPLKETAARDSSLNLSNLSKDPRSVLIQTRSRRTAERLAWQLKNKGIRPVYVYHSRLSAEERTAMENAFYRDPAAVLVTTGYLSNFVPLAAERPLQLIYWHPPHSLDETFAQLFRVVNPCDAKVEGHIFHTKEDFQWTLSTVTSDGPDIDAAQRRQRASLRKWRRWVLMEQCRYQSLVDLWQSTGAEMDFSGEHEPEALLPSPMPCGVCDRCQSKRSGLIFRSLFNRWLY